MKEDKTEVTELEEMFRSFIRREHLTSTWDSFFESYPNGKEIVDKSRPSPTPPVYSPGDDDYGRDKKFWDTPPETVEECKHADVKLSANGMYCQCKKCKKLLTRKAGDTGWHELEKHEQSDRRYTLPEEGMPQPSEVDAVAFSKSTKYYGGVHRDKNEFYDGFLSCFEWQLRQQLNFPENKQEQLNWFLVNVLRLFDDEQLKVLTKEIGERCGAFRQEWINVKYTPAPRDIEIWAYDDDGDICTIQPEFAEESDYEAVLFWQPFYRPVPPISK